MFKIDKKILLLILLLLFILLSLIFWYKIIYKNKLSNENPVTETKIESNKVIDNLNKPFSGNSTTTKEQIIDNLNKPFSGNIN